MVTLGTWGCLGARTVPWAPPAPAQGGKWPCCKCVPMNIHGHFTVSAWPKFCLQLGKQVEIPNVKKTPLYSNTSKSRGSWMNSHRYNTWGKLWEASLRMQSLQTRCGTGAHAEGLGVLMENGHVGSQSHSLPSHCSWQGRRWCDLSERGTCGFKSVRFALGRGRRLNSLLASGS